MLGDAAVADRAAFLRAEQRRNIKARVKAVLDSLRRRLRRRKEICFLRMRGADDLLYVGVRAGVVSAADGT